MAGDCTVMHVIFNAVSYSYINNILTLLFQASVFFYFQLLPLCSANVVHKQLEEDWESLPVPFGTMCFQSIFVINRYVRPGLSCPP